jgi:cytochrome c556
MKLILPVLVVSGLALSACSPPVDDSPGGKAAQARHDGFEELGKAAKSLNDQLESSTPNFTVIRSSATKIATLAPQVKDWFPAGSGPQDGKRTDAKAEVWTRPAEFERAHARLMDATNALTATVETGDTAAIAASAKTLGAACKNCHDTFKDD